MQIEARSEKWPIRGQFRISRGAKTEAHVVVVRITAGAFEGRGECVPYVRYGESVSGVLESIESIRQQQAPLSRDAIANLLPPGAARNALDCALWDLEARKMGQSAWQLAGHKASPRDILTAYTLSLDDPAAMAKQAFEHRRRRLLKLKLAGTLAADVERVRAVRQNAPGSAIIVDANEGFAPGEAQRLCDELHALNVALIEQPLPAGADAILGSFAHKVPICADESAHVSDDVEHLSELYDAVNIKLDKTGGLTEALMMARAATAAKMKVMVGCMVSTSLAIAPALLLARQADFVDLDGPLLLERDRPGGLLYEDDRVSWTAPCVWGEP